MSRLLFAKRMVLLAVLLIVSWCVMIWTHEVGHLVGGWCCGAQLTVAEVRPWHLPYSVFSPDPHPLLTLWAGPLLGVCLPVLVAAAGKRVWLWFIAYFCLLCNGVYLATAWFTGDAFLDTTRLLEHGANPWWIVLFCVTTIVPGYIGIKKAFLRLFCASTVHSEEPGDAAG